MYELLHIHADDFVRKLAAGEYDAQLDDLAHPEIMYLVSINPYRRCLTSLRGHQQKRYGSMLLCSNPRSLV